MAEQFDVSTNVDFDPDLVRDFRDEFQDAYYQVETILVELEKSEDKHDGLNALFRALHSVKSNLRMMQFNELSEFIHSLENILDDMRENRLAYDERFSDVTLLSLEQVRDAFDALFSGDNNPAQDLIPLKSILDKAHHEHDNFESHICTALLHLDPLLVEEADTKKDERPSDLDFFAHIANFIEHRLGYDDGATRRQLEMAEQMNALANDPIDIEQLRAAIYVHDVGMAFLPQDLVHKESLFTDEERVSLKEHPVLGAHLLSQLGIWYEASKMVLQHHERMDGTGYPNNLKQDDICHGAKLITIIDTFEAMTHSRAHRDQKRTVLRVVAEINAQSEKQFDPKWVEIFNRWIRQVYIRQPMKK